jgi:hypothetical protein
VVRVYVDVPPPGVASVVAGRNYDGDASLSRDTVPLKFVFQRDREMGSKSQEYKELFEKIDQEEDGEVYLRYMSAHICSVHKKLPKSSTKY